MLQQLSDTCQPRAATLARRYVFVGQCRSRRAIRMNACLESGRLAGKTLHDALRVLGLDPQDQVYLNLYRDEDPAVIDDAAVALVRELAAGGAVIVGMGRVVQRGLERAGIPHLRLVHPAARGAIRARATYQAHVALVLGRAAEGMRVQSPAA